MEYLQVTKQKPTVPEVYPYQNVIIHDLFLHAIPWVPVGIRSIYALLNVNFVVICASNR